MMTEEGNRAGDSTESQRIYENLIFTGKEELGYQMKIMLDRFDRTDRLIWLGVATLAGMTVVFGFLISHGPYPGAVASILLGGGVLVVMVAIYLLVRINTSLHRETVWELGPDTRESLRFVQQEEITEEVYHFVIADRLPDHIEANTEVIRGMSAQQGRASMVIIGGVILHLAGIVFILGGAILGLA